MHSFLWKWQSSISWMIWKRAKPLLHVFWSIQETQCTLLDWNSYLYIVDSLPVISFFLEEGPIHLHHLQELGWIKVSWVGPRWSQSPCFSVVFFWGTSLFHLTLWSLAFPGGMTHPPAGQGCDLGPNPEVAKIRLERGRHDKVVKN